MAHSLPPLPDRLTRMPRARLHHGVTPLEAMNNLGAASGFGSCWVKRDDHHGLAFGGNKVRQLEFYFGEALAQDADTVLITGAVQSNFVRLTAAAAAKLGLGCHVQLEERVDHPSGTYRHSGNVLVTKMLGATVHSYPDGEDEAGADAQLGVIAAELKSAGKRPYIIPLAPGHPPLGALGYVVAAHELLGQFAELQLDVSAISVASGSGNTHAGLLFGLRALESSIKVEGICVRRSASVQAPRLLSRCDQIAELLEMDNPVGVGDIMVKDDWLAPGYGVASDEVMHAILKAARSEALMLDPTYTGKAMAGYLAGCRTDMATRVFLHTGGTPGVFAYGEELQARL